MLYDGGMYEEDPNDTESLNYMFNNHGNFGLGQMTTSQSTGGFMDLSGLMVVMTLLCEKGSSQHTFSNGVPYAIQTTWPTNHGSWKHI